jgi:NAD(P)H-dependent FMN reductase
MKLSILSLSASETSVSRACAHALKDVWSGGGHNSVVLIDICSLPPRWVNDGGLRALPPEYAAADAELRSSDGIVLAHPVYCYTASSPAKAITEIFGQAFEKMPVGFIASAGTIRSHLAVGDLMLSMMFEQSTLCFPKSVLATKEDLDGDLPGPELAARIRAFADDFARFARVLRTYRNPTLLRAELSDLANLGEITAQIQPQI